ncbi:3-hydroxyacyl-CoA dehydrogenase [Saccharospirillum sp.]|uniref:3-hydroxyacyl-CoA dehydrogenase n=1 Tax=Saccharospirillum sp. TaxID=2033801 RepID=UPI0034A02EAB
MTQTPPLPLNATVAVIGAGTMGAGIAQVAAAAGHPVLLYDNRDGAAEAALTAMNTQLSQRVERGKITDEAKTQLLARMTPCQKLADLAQAALVIEAIVEDLAVKQSVFTSLETTCTPDTLFASNSSSLSITAIASKLNDPGRLAGMHFFNPAPVMKLCEVIAGLESRSHVIDTLLATARNWGKVAVRANNTPGFIVNRVARPYYTEAMKVYEEAGADIATLDALLKDAGQFPMGPFALTDLIGQDINLAVSQTVFASYYQDRRFEPSLVQQALVEGGLLGRKSGRGFYDYRDGAEPKYPLTITPGEPPKNMIVDGKPGLWQPLIERLSAAGITVQPGDPDKSAAMTCEGLSLKLTGGCTATTQARRSGDPNTILFDLAFDYASTDRLALSPADGSNPEAMATAAALFAEAGIQCSHLDDSPGLIVMRTVVMLCNLAADAVHKGVCSAEDADNAMKAGTNYPAGPIEWGERLGLKTVIQVLNELEEHYQDGRYRVSPWLKRRSA